MQHYLWILKNNFHKEPPVYIKFLDVQKKIKFASLLLKYARNTAYRVHGTVDRQVETGFLAS
jgi:hypothetical protein